MRELTLGEFSKYMTWKEECTVCIMDTSGQRYECVDSFRANNEEKIEEYEDYELGEVDFLENMIVLYI